MKKHNILRFETDGFVEFGRSDGAFAVAVGDHKLYLSVNHAGQVSVRGEGFWLRVWAGVDGLRSSGSGVDNVNVDDRRVVAVIGELSITILMLVGEHGDVDLVTIAASRKGHDVTFDIVPGV